MSPFQFPHSRLTSALASRVVSFSGYVPPVMPSAPFEEESTGLRWRGTILRLSDHFTMAAAAHPELASVLMEALGNALERLLLFGRDSDFAMIDEWLDEQLGAH